MAKKPHPADLYAAEQIARAVRFSAFYSAGRDGHVSIECASAEEAIAAADRLTRERGRFGRRAIAYAITPEGNSFPLGVEGYRTRSDRPAGPHGMPNKWTARRHLYDVEPPPAPDAGPIGDARQGDMLDEQSGPALSPLPQSAPCALSPATVAPPNQKDFAMSQPIARKFNADRAALRAATRTGQPHTIVAVPGGFEVVPVAPAPAPAIDPTQGAPAQPGAAGPRNATRYFAGTDGKITAFRASKTMAYQSVRMTGRDGTGIAFSQTPARFAGVGSVPVSEIVKGEYDALVALKIERIKASGLDPSRYTSPQDSWVKNPEATTAPVIDAAHAHPNQCTACGIKFRSYVAKGRHLCPAGDPPSKSAAPAKAPSARAKAKALEEAAKTADAAPVKAAQDAPKLARRRRPLATKPGEMPTPPDFTANTHKPYRKKLEALIAMAAAGDAAGLAAVAINPTSTSPKAMIRYRDAAIAAILLAHAQRA